MNRLLLAPRLISQAIGVRRQALQLPEASGPRSGTTGNGPVLSLLIIGDSSAAGVGVDHQRDALAGQMAYHLSQKFTLTWNLRARTGATTRSSLRALRADPPGRADVVMVVLGVNDVTRMIPQARWLRQQHALCTFLRSHVDPRMIYLTGLPPMGQFPLLPDPLSGVLGARATAFDIARKTVLPTGPGLRHIPLPEPFDASLMARDGFHPGADAYGIWGAQMANQIISNWPSN